MKFIKKNFAILTILAVSAFFFIFRLGRDLLFDWDECIYTSYVHSMRLANSYFVNIFNGKPIFDKPPLYMWILTASSVFGENEFAFRIGSAIATLVLIAVVYAFAKKYFSQRIAIVSTLVLLTSEAITSHGRIVNTDVFFTLFIFLGVWCWLKAKEARKFAYLSGFLFGLAVMVKGLGSIQYLGVLFVCALLDRDRKTLILYGKVFAAFLLTIIPWHLGAYLIYGKEFFTNYFLDNIVKRSLYPIEFHHERWYFYILLFWNEFKPWIIFGISFPLAFLIRAKRYMNVSKFESVWKRRQVLITIILLVALPFLMIMRVKTKLYWYAMPIMPFLSIYLAYCMELFIFTFASSLIKGKLNKQLITAIYVILIALLSIDAFVTLVNVSRPLDAKRDINPRNELAIRAAEYPEKTLEYLVPFGERQAKEILPPNETLAQTFRYGGTACAVQYSKKIVNFYYKIDEFENILKTKHGLFIVPNADAQLIDSIQSKTIILKNAEYTLFRK